MSPEGESIKPHDKDGAVDSEDLAKIRLKAAQFPEKKIMTRRDSC